MTLCQMSGCSRYKLMRQANTSIDRCLGEESTLRQQIGLRRCQCGMLKQVHEYSFFISAQMGAHDGGYLGDVDVADFE